MKFKLSLFLFILSIYNYAQNYIEIDELRNNFVTKEYTLDTNDLYKIDKEIKVYNIYISKNTIILFSVLPSLEKEGNWIKIDKEKIQQKILPTSKLYEVVQNWLENNKPSNKTLQYNLIKKIGEEYFVSRMCLTEIFVVQKTKYPIIQPYGVININEPKLKIREMEKVFKEQFPQHEFIMNPNNKIIDLDISYVKKYYLSEVFKLGKYDAYKFWTFDNWAIVDGYNTHRGIDRFIYIDGLGIVGGSYDFYFEIKPKLSSNSYFTVSKENLWDNILNEKVMIANELK